LAGPLHSQPGDDFALFHHFVDGEALFSECACGACLNAFATAGAVARMAPIILEVGDEAGVDAARGDLPNVRSLDLGANPDAARAEDAPVVIENEARMGHIDGKAGIVIGVPDMGYAERLSHGLKLAVAVGDAGRADVVALHEEQLNSHAAIERELFRGSPDGHAVLDGRGAGGQQAVSAGQLHHADAACTNGAEALQVAERGNLLSVGAGGLEDGVALMRRHQLTINADGNGFVRHSAVPFVLHHVYSAIDVIRKSQRRQRRHSSSAS
jgi:hypothetical protein